MDIRKLILLACFYVAIGACGADNNSGNNQSPGGSPPPPPPPPPPPSLATCENKIPPEQPPSVRYEFNPYPIPPPDYGAVIGWVNATIGTGGSSGKVIVNNLRLWENYQGVDRLVAETITCPSCTDPNSKVWGYTVLKSEWRTESAWDKPNEGTKFQTQDNKVIVPVGNLPNYVYHFWHTYWPRPAIRSGARYYLISEAVVEGDAMVQIGIDYWQYTDKSNDSNHKIVQAAVSNWHCASSMVQTVRAGAYK